MNKVRAAFLVACDMGREFQTELEYVRYPIDFLCAVIATKAEAENYQAKTSKVFLQKKLAH